MDNPEIMGTLGKHDTIK